MHTFHIEPWLWRLFQFLAREVEYDARCALATADIALTGLQLIDPAAVSSIAAGGRSDTRCNA